MYININRIYIQKHNCDDCKNNNICKYCSDMKSAKEYLNNMPKIKGSNPINISVVCSNFEKKAQRQDGFNHWNQMR